MNKIFRVKVTEVQVEEVSADSEENLKVDRRQMMQIGLEDIIVEEISRDCDEVNITNVLAAVAELPKARRDVIFEDMLLYAIADIFEQLNRALDRRAKVEIIRGMGVEVPEGKEKLNEWIDGAAERSFQIIRRLDGSVDE